MLIIPMNSDYPSSLLNAKEAKAPPVFGVPWRIVSRWMFLPATVLHQAFGIYDYSVETVLKLPGYVKEMFTAGSLALYRHEIMQINRLQDRQVTSTPQFDGTRAGPRR
jgi:hypothetical protein